jgi:hypothetical protein
MQRNGRFWLANERRVKRRDGGGYKTVDFCPSKGRDGPGTSSLRELQDALAMIRPILKILSDLVALVLVVDCLAPGSRVWVLRRCP